MTSRSPRHGQPPTRPARAARRTSSSSPPPSPAPRRTSSPSSSQIWSASRRWLARCTSSSSRTARGTAAARCAPGRTNAACRSWNPRTTIKTGRLRTRRPRRPRRSAPRDTRRSSLPAPSRSATRAGRRTSARSPARGTGTSTRCGPTPGTRTSTTCSRWTRTCACRGAWSGSGAWRDGRVCGPTSWPRSGGTTASTPPPRTSGRPSGARAGPPSSPTASVGGTSPVLSPTAPSHPSPPRRTRRGRKDTTATGSRSTAGARFPGERWTTAAARGRRKGVVLRVCRARGDEECEGAGGRRGEGTVRTRAGRVRRAALYSAPLLRARSDCVYSGSKGCEHAGLNDCLRTGRVEGRDG
ncbi:hypothetical protein DFJ74DRAFT_760644, partial [Hyaloraphidium curvatum]